MHDQLHFADATGDAVVISTGPDGKVAFTRKPAGDGTAILSSSLWRRLRLWIVLSFVILVAGMALGSLGK
jgi:hypothetical protein